MASSSTKRRVDPDSSDEDIKPAPKKQSTSARTVKKNYIESSEEDEEVEVKPKAALKAPAKRSKAKKEDDDVGRLRDCVSGRRANILEGHGLGRRIE